MPRTRRIPSWWITPQQWTEALENRGSRIVGHSDQIEWKPSTVVFGPAARETFRWLMWSFSVDQAKEFIRTNPRPIISYPINLATPYLGAFMGVQDDGKRHMKDSEEMRFPLIIGRMTMGARRATKNRKARTLHPWIIPLDGWHRIATAKDLGLEFLPAVLLTEAETREVAGVAFSDKL